MLTTVKNIQVNWIDETLQTAWLDPEVYILQSGMIFPPRAILKGTIISPYVSIFSCANLWQFLSYNL